jgi:PAS domain S-box-containing protein
MSGSSLSRRLTSPVILNYGIAILLVAAAAVADFVLRWLWGIAPTVSLFLCAIVFVAWAEGPGPALLATALAVFSFYYFFLPPFYSLALKYEEIPRLVLLALAALFVLSLSAAQRRTAASLRLARDEQQEMVKELQELNEKLRVENAERRQAEERRSRAEKELQLTVDTIPVLVARYRPDGTMDFRNKTWRDYTGLSQDNLEGQRWGSALHPDDLALVEREWRSHIATGGPFELEQRLRRADGEYRRHWVRRVPLHDDSGNVIKWYAVAFDIEDRRLAEEAQRRSEAALSEARRELQLTIDSIPVMVSTFDPDGTRSFVNQQWQNYTGHTQREATGKGLNTSVYYHPDDVQRFDNAWRVAQAKGETLSVDVRTRRADGTYRWYTMRRAPFRDERGNIVKWYSIGVDVDDQKVAENALQRSEAYLAEAQKLSLTGSIAWDRANDDHFWSDETYQIMGFDRSVKPSMGLIMQRVHPDDRAHLQHEVDRAAQGAQTHAYEQRLLMPDGQIKYLHVRAHRVRYASGKEEIVGALMDITESRKSQAALDAAQAALAHASRVAMLGEISASIAHEVNQPLAAIVANGQACMRFLRRETPDLNNVRGAIEWIVKDGNRAGEVIRRVRGLLKKADTQKALLDVNDIVSEVAALLQRELAAQHVTLRLELTSAMPLIVGDRVQLQQVIINLVVNGVDAMQAVTDRSHALLISSYEDEAHQIVVAVKDSGVGIPAGTADRLFDAFFSTKPSGLGIGLSICRSIIGDHGGRLWATNNTGEPGATFQFALPSHQEQAPSAGTCKLAH